MAKAARNAVENLEAQAQRVAEVAAEKPAGLAQEQLSAAHNTLTRLARAEARREQSPVLDLPWDATPKELRDARQRRAVRCGQDVLLPSWTDAAVALPNALLRSSLFAASASSQGFVSDARLAVQGDVTLIFTGERLTSYDRRTFAACLDHYREDTPLSSEGRGKWVRTTYWAFAAAMGVAYGANVHRAIRASLIRLNAANLRVRVKGRSVPLRRMVQVAFDEGIMETSSPDDALRGSDAIVFRIDETMAHLFGPADWTAVPKYMLANRTGLASWIAAYYSTHKAPYALEFSNLYDWSGVTCTKAEFRRLLQSALRTLQAANEDDPTRVERFAMTKTNVWVCLARWRFTGPCPLKIEEDI